MAFDSETDQLWVGDVGQVSYEEVNIVTAGANLGWPFFEGDSCFEHDAYTSDIYGVSAALPCPDSEDFEPPVIFYDHTEKCAVVGGVVYRGSAISWLQGTYLFGDYCSGQVWALDGDTASGWRMIEIADFDRPLSSFGTDADGEVLVLTFDAPILQLVEVASDYASSVTHTPAATILTIAPNAVSRSGATSP